MDFRGPQGELLIADANGQIIPHATAHLNGGSDPIDADRLEISETVSNYTPASGGAATANDDLTAHLRGIDTEIGSIQTDVSTLQTDVSTLQTATIPYVFAYSSVSQTVTNNTYKNYLWNTHYQDNSGGTLHSTSTNTDRFYADRDGIWSFRAWHYYQTSGYGNLLTTIVRVLHYNTSDANIAIYGYDQKNMANSNGYSPNVSADGTSIECRMLDGEYLIFQVYYVYWPGGTSLQSIGTATNFFNGAVFRYVGAF